MFSNYVAISGRRIEAEFEKFDVDNGYMGRNLLRQTYFVI